jgi:lysozyme family protein
MSNHASEHSSLQRDKHLWHKQKILQSINQIKKDNVVHVQMKNMRMEKNKRYFQIRESTTIKLFFVKLITTLQSVQSVRQIKA